MTGRPLILLSILAFTLGACDGSPTEPLLRGALGEGQTEHWTTAPPESRGLDPSVLLELETRIDGGEFGAISSMLIVRNGVMVYERYWGAWGPGDQHVVNSVTKSVTSLLVGIADADGRLAELETPILDLFPEYPSVAEPEGKERITLRHALQMRTGLEWDEWATNYSNTTNPTYALWESPDWIKFVLDLPLESEPGSRFVYNSGVSMLLAGVLAHATGRSAESFAAERLFAPLGISSWSWDHGPDGLTNSGWGLQLRPRDMATIGQMLLQDGEWAGVQVVPADWLEDSTLPATRFVDGTGYGYQWWLGADDGGGRPVAAWGYGGQYIVAIPSLDLVVVSTAENFAGGGFTPFTLADLIYRTVAVPSH